MKTRTAVVAIAAAAVVSGGAAGSAVMLASGGHSTSAAPAPAAQASGKPVAGASATPGANVDIAPTRAADDNSHPLLTQHSYPAGTTSDAAGATQTAQEWLSAFINNEYTAACQLMTTNGRDSALPQGFTGQCESGLRMRRGWLNLDAADEKALYSEKVTGQLKVLFGVDNSGTSPITYDVPTVYLSRTDVTTADGTDAPYSLEHFKLIYKGGQWLVDDMRG